MILPMASLARVLFLLAALAAVAAFAARQFVLPPSALPTSPGVPESVPPVLEPFETRVSTPGPLRAPPDAAAGVLTQEGVRQWTNEARGNEGGRPFARHALLEAAAEKKVADMFARQYFAHDNPDGDGAAVLVKAAGYAYLRVGENLALGNFSSDEALVRAWMESPGHRANILQPRFTEIGVAVRRGAFEGRQVWMAVQLFALPRSACPVVDAKLRSIVEEQRTTVMRLGEEVDRLAEEGRAKIEDGNREIEEGNRVYRETGDREAAVPQWQRGEHLQADGRALLESARAKATEAEAIRQELNVNVVRYNAQVEASNACIGG